jgi:peptidyl-prolyl cis-trans isomerase C
MFFIVVKILFFVSTSSAIAEDPSKVVAAKVNNHVITAQDVLNALNLLPEKMKQQPLSNIYPNIVNELINQHLITKQAYKEKFDLNKNIVLLLKKNKDQIIARYWLNNFLDKQVKKGDINLYYNNYIKNFKPSKEFNASHILLKSKEEAFEIIRKLEKKSKFSELAKKHSIGPSGKNDGKLGWFQSGQMVEAFEKATFNLKKGSITKVPVKTKFGYHVIMLNDIRNSKPKALDIVKKQIVKRIRKLSLSNLEKKIRENQNITIVDFENVAKKVNK